MDPREVVLGTVHKNATALLGLARRHSLCADDAHDAYQRGIEIFLRRADTVEPETALAWIRTVIKHEAIAVRRSRLQLVGGEEVDLDSFEASTVPSPEEQVANFERITASAEALQRLKPQEVRALWLKAQGLSYAEIGELTGWSYTKVNRCITEGRRAFIERYERIESGKECEQWAPVLSAMADGEATAEQLLEVRPHLRNCPACRATIRAFHATRDDIQSVLPVPAFLAATNGVAAKGSDVASAIDDRFSHLAAGLRAVLTTVRDTLTGLMGRNPTSGEAAGAALVGGGGVAAGGAKLAALCVSVTVAAGGTYCLDAAMRRDGDRDGTITAAQDRRVFAGARLRAGDRATERRQGQQNRVQIVQQRTDAAARRLEGQRARERAQAKSAQSATNQAQSAPTTYRPPQPTPTRSPSQPTPTADQEIGFETDSTTTPPSTTQTQAPSASTGGDFAGGGFEK